MLAGLVLTGLMFPRLVGLRLARQVGLRLTGAERHLAGTGHSLRIGHLVAIIEGVVAHVARIILGAVELRVVLAELLLRGGNQAKIVLGVLVVVLCRYRIAGSLRITGELEVFLGNVGGSSADLDVGTVRLKHPSHRILTLAVASTHPLVLTVSHDLPAATLRCDGLGAAFIPHAFTSSKPPHGISYRLASWPRGAASSK